MSKPPEWASFQAERDASTGQLLLKAARLWNEQALQRFKVDRPSPLGLAHTRLLPHLDREGVQQVVLAQRLGISKQAVGKLVSDLEREGVVERIPDPEDGRAHLVRFTADGVRSLVEGVRVLVAMEGALVARLGPRRWRELHRSLQEVIEHLESQPDLSAGPRRPRTR